MNTVFWKLALSVGLLLAVALRALAPPPNVQVNQADSSTGTNDNFTSQNEPCHAVFGNTIVVGYNDTRQLGNGLAQTTSFQGLAYSTNGGLTFTDAGQLPPAPNFVNWIHPALAVDSAGNFYYAGLAMPSPAGSGGSTHVAVAKSTSTTPTVAFGTPVLIAGTYTGATAFQEKELMAIDTTGGPFNDRVYVAWSNFQDPSSANSRILLVRSTSNSPLAFADAVQLSPPADESGTISNLGAMPAVGPNGEVYVVWGRFGWSNVTRVITSSSLRIVKSTDGGMSFRNPDSADPAPNKTIANPVITPGAMTSGAVKIGTVDYPYIAVDRTSPGSPTRGYVYVVFQADPDGPGPDRSDIYFTRSTDGGITWGMPLRINAGPAVTVNPDPTTNDNWQPSIAVSPTSGQISVTFYDRRGDPANLQIALFRAVSTDGGLTWSNDQISSGSFTPNTSYDPLFGDSGYMGLYNWSVADRANFHFTWTDCRNTANPPPGSPNPSSPPGRTDQDVFYAKTAVLLTGPHPFITPRGKVTGVSPQRKSPDIFVVDAADNQINAVKGQVNRLRARVSTLGNASAMGAVVRIKYAPWFAGLTDAALKQIATVTLDFGAAGDPKGNDVKVVPINWDHTDLTDTNDGQWPGPISAFQHLSVKVSVEFADDINSSNNQTQTNFSNVPTVTGRSLVAFRVGNPLEKEVEGELVAEIPPGFRAELEDFPVKFVEKFRLKAKEVKVEKLGFVPPEGLAKQAPRQEVMAHLGLKVGRDTVGGTSFPLAQAEKAGERIIAKDFDAVWDAVLAVLKEKGEPVALADKKKGIINTRSKNLDNKRLRALVEDGERKVGERLVGRYLLTVEVKRAGNQTKVTVTRLILVNTAAGDFAVGQPLPSNGTLEREHLEAITKRSAGGS
jgi:hypothetical protein